MSLIAHIRFRRVLLMQRSHQLLSTRRSSARHKALEYRSHLEMVSHLSLLLLKTYFWDLTSHRAADNGFDLLWQRHALPLLVAASQPTPPIVFPLNDVIMSHSLLSRQGAAPAGTNLSAAPMWLESIIASSLRRK